MYKERPSNQIALYVLRDSREEESIKTYSGRQMNLLLSLLRRSAAVNRLNPPGPPTSCHGDDSGGGTAADLAAADGDTAALGSPQLCTVADECCMFRSNSSKLMACPMLSDGSLPADACARSSGENQRASWLLVGDRPPSRL